MKDISLKELLEAGCHFGHQVPRWNPKAASFIYTARDGVHIIDLAKTKTGLEEAAVFVKTTASHGGSIIFVGTKRQARGIVEEEAKKVGVMYLVERWPGGLLTNWWEMKKNLEKLGKMKEDKKAGSWQGFTKKEQLLLERELNKLENLYGGIANLADLPATLFLIDVRKEEAAVREAIKTGVKTVAIIDTNANPDFVDFPIPANDDAVGSIRLITSFLADAYDEGKKLFEKKPEKEEKKEAPEQKEKSSKKKITVKKAKSKKKEK